MKMKQLNFWFFFISLFLYSCSSDEDENMSINNVENRLMNIAWVSTDIEYNEYGSGNIEERKEFITMYFLKNNIGVYHELVRWKDVYDSGSWEDALLFTYTLDGNKIIIRYKNGSRVDYTFTGKTLYNSKLESHSKFEAKGTMTVEDYGLIEEFFPTKGICGPNLTWQYNIETQSLEVKGTGPMYNYEEEGSPWYDYDSEKWDIVSVAMEEGVTSIGTNAFRYTRDLRKAILPSTMEVIGDYAFFGTELSEISFGGKDISESNLTHIGAHALNYGLSFPHLILPKTLKVIGSGAFYQNDIEYLELNEGLLSVDYAAFSGNNIQNDLYLPNSLKVIDGGYEGSFSKIVLGTDFTDISSFAFETTATSGKLYIKKKTPFRAYSIERMIVDKDLNSLVSEWTLYVPTGSKAVYEATYGWNRFKEIVEDASL